MSDVGLRSERGPILLALMLATFLIAIDATILSTAVPTIVSELGGFTLFPWLFSAYLLAQAASVPVYAKLADTFGRAPVIYTGIALFLAGSVLCAAAWDMASLIAFRAVQGLGAGAILPTALTIAGDIYTLRERARVQAYLSSVWAVSSVTGPTLGGLFTQFISWRWIFWVNVPIGLVTVFLLWRNYRPEFERHRQRVDVGGAVLLTAALVLLIVGVLESGQAWAWLSWQTAFVFGAGFALLGAFVALERRVTDPVIAPWVFRSPLVRTTSLVSLSVGVLLIGLVSYTPTFLEASLDVPPVVAGLTVAALTLGWPLSGALAGHVYLRIGFRATMLIGSSLTVLGTLALTGFSLTPSVPLTALGCFVVGLGLGLVANPALIAAQSSVGLRERGVVSGANSLSRSVGGAVGVAVFGAIANAVIASRGGTAAPEAIHAGGVGVYAGVAVAALVLAATCASIPHVPIADDPPPATPAP